jgi:hypothetical protein
MIPEIAIIGDYVPRSGNGPPIPAMFQPEGETLLQMQQMQQ